MMSVVNNLIVSFNNQGVAQLENGQYTCALMCFKEALETLKQLIEDPTVNTDSANTNCPERPFQWSNRHERLSSNTCCDGKRQDMAFIFERAIVLVPPGLENCEKYYSTTEFSALLYNFALTNHILGLNGEHSLSITCLTKALALYDMAISLIQIEADEVKMRSTSAMLAVAILNNMGQIQQELGMFDSASTSFELLLQEWLCLTGEGQAAPSRFMDESDRKGVCMNLYLYSHTPNTAPAA